MDVVKSIILSQLLLENNEELKGTKFIGKSLKET